MKKMYLFLTVTLVLLVVASAASLPVKPADKKSQTAVAPSSIPEELNTIFKNSCMGCHAAGGKSMAMAKVNFSDWDKYSPEKQAKKAAAICKMITKGAMPPKSFRDSHPDAIPTAAQKDMICKWSDTLASKK
jgi:cytochrome c5